MYHFSLLEIAVIKIIKLSEFHVAKSRIYMRIASFLNVTMQRCQSQGWAESSLLWLVQPVLGLRRVQSNDACNTEPVLITVVLAKLKL